MGKFIFLLNLFILASCAYKNPTSSIDEHKDEHYTHATNSAYHLYGPSEISPDSNWVFPHTKKL